MVGPNDVGPDAVCGRCSHLNSGVDLSHPVVLPDVLCEEVMGLSRIGDQDPLSRELDERRHRVVLGDRRHLPIDQGTGVGVEELCVNLIVPIHRDQATPRP